jgi:predicted nucleic acid-binding protein
VRELVLDASVVLKWFARAPEPGARDARRLRNEFERGDLIVLGPTLLHLEILNVAGRRWGWPEETLLDLAAALDDLGIDLLEPELAGIARWVGAGLTAFDAAYVTVAESARVPLVTADEEILRLAAPIAEPLLGSR